MNSVSQNIEVHEQIILQQAANVDPTTPVEVSVDPTTPVEVPEVSAPPTTPVEVPVAPVEVSAPPTTPVNSHETVINIEESVTVKCNNACNIVQDISKNVEESIGKIDMLLIQMNALSSQGFSVQPSIVSLNDQKRDLLNKLDHMFTSISEYLQILSSSLIL